jgi:hypothetical protein
MTGYLISPLHTIAPSIRWIAISAAAVIVLFAIYVGVALAGILITHDIDAARIRYEALRELLKVFRRRQQ